MKGRGRRREEYEACASETALAHVTVLVVLGDFIYHARCCCQPGCLRCRCCCCCCLMRHFATSVAGTLLTSSSSSAAARTLTAHQLTHTHTQTPTQQHTVAHALAIVRKLRWSTVVNGRDSRGERDRGEGGGGEVKGSRLAFAHSLK